MKSHTKKKAYRAWCKEQAKAGKINTAEGLWTARSNVGGSMGRDYVPQQGGK